MKTRDLGKGLRWGTAVITVFYTVIFFSKLTWSYLEWRAARLDIDWTVPTNPQSMIALCFVTATLAVWFLRDKGEILAGLLFGVILVFFGYWAILTHQIKINMGVSSIPQAGWISNFWIGATWLDPLVLFLTLGLLALDAYLLFKAERPRSRARLSPSHP